MSHVTNVLLYVGWSEDGEPPEEHSPCVEAVNDWLRDGGYGLLGYLPGDADFVGGHKVLEAILYVGAMNHLEIGPFLQEVFAQPWKEPRNIQVFLMDQHEERFSLIDSSNFKAWTRDPERMA